MSARDDATYPPLDVPKPVAEDVWMVDSGPQRMLGLPFPIRMTVIRLRDGALWLHSPTRFTPALGAALTALGPVRHLVAPDTAHWTHLAGWQAAHPEATVWAAPGVAERARKQGAAVRFDRELGAEAPAGWAAEIGQALFTAPGFAEVAFHHRPSATLVLTDTVQNLEPDRLPFAMRLLTRAVGTAAPAGGTPVYLRLLLRRRAVREANRATAERLIALTPRRVIFAHGAWFEEDAAARLERALAWLLR